MTSTSRGISTRSAILLALIGLLFLASGVATWFLRPSSKFTALAQLHIAVDRVNDDVNLRKQVLRIEDRFTIAAALRDPAIANLPTIKEQADAVQWLDDKLVIEFPSPEFIHISLSGDRPDELKKVLGAVTKAYMDNYVDKEKKARDAKKKSLDAINGTAQKKLEEKKSELRAKQEGSRAVDPEGVALIQQMALEELQSVRRRITEVHNKILLLQVEMGLHPDWEEKSVPHVGLLMCSHRNCLAP